MVAHVQDGVTVMLGMPVYLRGSAYLMVPEPGKGEELRYTWNMDTRTGVDTLVEATSIKPPTHTSTQLFGNSKGNPAMRQGLLTLECHCDHDSEIIKWRWKLS